MAAPLGNKNAHKGRMWHDALRKAITQDDGKRLRKAAEILLDKAAEGEGWAIREIADRLDGKPFQSVELTGDADNPLVQKIQLEIVDPKA